MAKKMPSKLQLDLFSVEAFVKPIDFGEMRRLVASTRPWAVNIRSLAIRFPNEPLTVAEREEIARFEERVKKAGRTLVQLAKQNQERESTMTAPPCHRRFSRDCRR